MNYGYIASYLVNSGIIFLIDISRNTVKTTINDQNLTQYRTLKMLILILFIPSIRLFDNLIQQSLTVKDYTKIL